MSNPNPFVPKGSLLDQQSQRRSRLKLAVFCVLAISVTGLVAMLIQGCKRTPPDDSSNNPFLTDTNNIASGNPTDTTSTNPVADTNIPAYTPPNGTNVTAYTPPPAPPTPPPQPPAPPEQTSSDYVVVAGDTLAKIAKANGVSLKALEAANPGVDSRHLKVKQKLVLPASTKATELATGPTTDGTATASEDIYVVKAGDTLSKIARAHGTTVKALEAANNLTTTRINVGKKLKLPQKEEAAPVAPPVPDNTATAPPMTPPSSGPSSAPAPGSAPAPSGNNP